MQVSSKSIFRNVNTYKIQSPPYFIPSTLIACLMDLFKADRTLASIPRLASSIGFLDLQIFPKDLKIDASSNHKIVSMEVIFKFDTFAAF